MQNSLYQNSQLDLKWKDLDWWLWNWVKSGLIYFWHSSFCVSRVGSFSGKVTQNFFKLPGRLVQFDRRPHSLPKVGSNLSWKFVSGSTNVFCLWQMIGMSRCKMKRLWFNLSGTRHWHFPVNCSFRMVQCCVIPIDKDEVFSGSVLLFFLSILHWVRICMNRSFGPWTSSVCLLNKANAADLPHWLPTPTDVPPRLVFPATGSLCGCARFLGRAAESKATFLSQIASSLFHQRCGISRYVIGSPFPLKFDQKSTGTVTMPARPRRRLEPLFFGQGWVVFFWMNMSRSSDCWHLDGWLWSALMAAVWNAVSTALMNHTSYAAWH